MQGSNQAVYREHEELVFPCVKPAYREPLALVEGKGVHVTDANGKTYLDMFAGILTTSVGHCHQEVVERIHRQASRIGHTSPLYVNEQQVGVAKRLRAIAPGGLATCHFTNSGTEAVESAITLARLYTGRQEIIALRHGYSGSSTLATNLTAHARWRPIPDSVVGIKHARSPYTYRNSLDPAEDAAEYFVRDIEEVIATTTSGRPAAFIAETIQGVGGCIVPPKGYFRRAAEIIRSYGGLFICDEVQTGFGRTGSHWFGIEHWEVTPDIMVMAKGIANGFPVGATIARPEIAACWTARAVSTFGGNPVAMAAAAATLDVMHREDTPGRSEARGRQLRAGLEALYARHAWIGEVRGMGLMQALELVVDRDAKVPDPARATALLEASREEGLLLGVGGLEGHVIRLGPSLLVTQAEIAEALERLGRACVRAEIMDVWCHRRTMDDSVIKILQL